MQNPKQSHAVKLVAAAILALPVLLGSAAATAGPTPERLAGVDAVAGSVRFQPEISYDHVRVTVSGPGHFEIVRTFGADETPEIELPGIDGLYKYELRFGPKIGPRDRRRLTAARKSGQDGADLGLALADRKSVQSGSFWVIDGGVVAGDLVEQNASASPADASSIVSKPPQQVVLTTGNGVIRNSLCVGFDCPNSPSFSDSTILLMENNTRIKFGDTSNSPFPTNDWEIEANGQGSGGVSYLAFNDCGTADNDGGCTTDLVFGVEAGARARALWVETDGDVGIGTGNPVVDLHIVRGDTPALRLDQDGSSGFAPQTWDVAGNETNFFVRDVTNGSQLPFRIRPDAPTNSIFVENDGNVGLGTSSPDANLSVVETTSGVNNVFRTENNGNSTWVVEGTAAGQEETFFMNWVQTLDDLNLTYSGVANNFRFSFNDGNLTMNGDVITNMCPAGCGPDYVFEPGYELMSLTELESFVQQNRHLPNVPSAADNASGIKLATMQLRLLEKIEELTLYTIAQHKTIEALGGEVEALTERLAELEGQRPE